MPAFADAAIIEASLALAAAQGDPTVPIYARLFAQAPEMQPLFCQDRKDTVKGEMLARALETLLDYIGDRHYAAHLLRAERAAHNAYGVPPAVFDSFYTIIAETLADRLGAEWTPAMALAWRALIADLDADTTA